MLTEQRANTDPILAKSSPTAMGRTPLPDDLEPAIRRAARNVSRSASDCMSPFMMSENTNARPRRQVSFWRSGRSIAPVQPDVRSAPVVVESVMTTTDVIAVEPFLGSGYCFIHDVSRKGCRRVGMKCLELIQYFDSDFESAGL